jgi:hypothetical protein
MRNVCSPLSKGPLPVNSNRFTRLTGFMWIVVPTAFTAVFTLLQINFEYPDILRQPAGEVLIKFQAGGASLLSLWYSMLLTALFSIPAMMMLHRVIAERENAPTYLLTATVFGVIAGVVQSLGFLRWSFIVPYFAAAYTNPNVSVSQQETLVFLFEAFHRYLGMGVGEHLGYLFTSLWTVMIAVALHRTGVITMWWMAIGVLMGVGVAAGLLEPAGVAWAGVVNAIAYLLWAVWLVGVGIALVIPTLQQRRMVVAGLLA